MKKNLILVLLLVVSSVCAEEEYSFEKAEELKPLIEWRDYSSEAFQEALDENKPVFLLLTAPSWCYWCQVYESEDYLFNSRVVELLNEEFIPVYVDADKRQDLTRQYLEGGWPSTTVMTPSGERIYGYSGPRAVDNMLANLDQAVNYVKTSSSNLVINYNYEKKEQVIPTEDQLNNLINNYQYTLLGSYDYVYGGFGSGQKFPQGRSLDYSLELYEKTEDEQWLNLVKNTLENQYTSIGDLDTNYNLFDPVEGGFHRYGTERDWTPPHYEKMLYDNVRLLKTYYHLRQIEDYPLVNEVVDKTLEYIELNYYDSNGGFYGNTDVNGEDAYYGKIERGEKARVEKTKYTDWNSEAILTYLYLYDVNGDSKYKEMASKSLDFFADEMIEEGAYHYFDGEKGVRGNLLDNSYLMLAFVEGYEVLNNERYLFMAKRLADYSLDNLYDWNSGGFFERNSPDVGIYALGDNVLLSKPSQENGVITYALLKLYSVENDVIYLGSAIRTLGINEISSLDRGYYSVKSAEYILENDLLELDLSEFNDIEDLELESFWLSDLLEDKLTNFVVSNEGLEVLDGSLIILILIALFAGLISFASPCSLPIIPAYVAYAFNSSKKNIKGMTLSFFLGLSLVFILLGMTSTFIGQFLKSNILLFSKFAGLVLIFFGLYILSERGFSGFSVKRNKPKSYFGSFLFGAMFSLSWTPCVGPILVAILLLASTVGSVLNGGVLLLFYSIGLALPLVLISLYLDKVDKSSKLWRFIEGKELKIGRLKIHRNTLISGLLFVILGYLIYSGVLYSFNQYITSSFLQEFIFDVEDRLLSLIR